jgi:hypothetical protein
MAKKTINGRQSAMKKIIIGIHGLGNKPPKFLLQKWWKDAMLEGFKTHGINKKLPYFELVYWVDILYEKPLNNWEKDNKNQYFLDEPYIKAPKSFETENHPFRKKLTDFISEQLKNIFLNEDKTLNYSFLTDIILKKYFRDLNVYYIEECKDENDISCKARDLIRNRIAQVIKKYKEYEIFIVAHSMGSIIVFDVLNYIIPEIEINTLVTMGSPLGLPVVVGKIAAEQKRKLNDKSIMATPPGITTNWYNMSDIMDHVALNYKLADDFIQNERKISPKDFLVQNNYQINGIKNPHKSFGYLRTPEFSAILNDFIGDKSLNIGQKVLGKVQGFMNKVKEQHEIIMDKLKQNK